MKITPSFSALYQSLSERSTIDISSPSENGSSSALPPG